MAKKNQIEVTFEVADGYVSGKRPQKAMIDISDLEDCDSEEEVRELVECEIKEAFERKIQPDWDTSEVDRVVERWKEMKSERESNK